MDSHYGYCGCCGEGPTTVVGDGWCQRCKDHVAPYVFGTPVWDRTYFARTGEPCPYQV